MSPSEEPPRIARVELRCSDVGASARFYAELIGLEVTMPSVSEATLSSTGSAAPLLRLRLAERPGRAPRATTGLFHAAFRFTDRAGLGQALERATDRLGTSPTGAADHGVSEALYFDDPDGIGIELYRDRPREEWPAPDDGERVAMFTRPLDLGPIIAAAGEGAGAGPVIGHVHLKVASIAAAERFWTEEVGMELMTRFGSQASFLAFDGYHHHVGANTWLSAGAPPEPAEGAGLDAIAVLGGGAERVLSTPDRVPVVVEPAG